MGERKSLMYFIVTIFNLMQARAEFLQKFLLLFRRFEDAKISFSDYLRFSEITIKKTSSESISGKF